MSTDSMTWGYSAALETEGQQSQQPVAASLTMQPEPIAPAFNAEQIDTLKMQFMQLPPEQQTAIITAMTTQGIQGPQEVAAYLQNAMSQTATGLDLAIERGELAMAQAAGRTGVNEEDVTRVVAQAEAMTAQMMAQGASDREIQQAVAQLPGNNLETAAVVEAKVEQQLATDKFNMFSTRNADESLAAQNTYGVSAERMNYRDFGSTTAALASMGQFTPQPDLPNLGQGQTLSV